MIANLPPRAPPPPSYEDDFVSSQLQSTKKNLTERVLQRARSIRSSSSQQLNGTTSTAIPAAMGTGGMIKESLQTQVQAQDLSQNQDLAQAQQTMQVQTRAFFENAAIYNPSPIAFHVSFQAYRSRFPLTSLF
jgi:hypothetical protein